MIKLKQVPLYVGAMAVYPYDPAIEKMCTFMSKFNDPVCLAVKKHDRIMVPVNFAPPCKNDQRRLHPKVAINCKAPPKDEDQAKCIDQSVALLEQGVNHLFEAPTGWGKSYAGVAIACRIQQPTLIIVTKTDLIDGWIKNLVHVAGIPMSQIGHVQAAKLVWQGKPIVIAMVHTVIIEDKLPQEFYDYFGLIIFDEVHRMGAEFFMKACTMFTARLRLGLSATPDRTDGKMLAVHAHIGTVMVRGSNVPMSPKVLVVKTNWKIPTHDAETGKPIFWANGRMGSVTKQMGLSNSRNSVILQFVKQAYDKNRNIVIMADQLEGFLGQIYKVLLSAGINPMDIGFYIGGKSKAELDIAKYKKIVLATYAMCSEGTDVPHWDTLVMGTPRSNVKQIIGRVMRFVTGKPQPVVLDLVDGSAVFNGYHKKRLKQYFEVGATIVNM